MSRQSDITRVGQLVLARLLVAGENGATWNALKKDLEPLLGHRWAGGELERRLRDQVAELEAASLAVILRKGKTEKPVATPEGRRRALEALGLDRLPPKINWGQLRKTLLAAQALGLRTPNAETAKLFGSDDGFKAVLLEKHFQLGLGDYPTLPRALDALIWKLLGFPSGKKLDLAGVKAALIRRELSETRAADGKADPKKEVTKLLARCVGARQSGKDELRLAAIRSWLDEEVAGPTPSVAVPPPAHTIDPSAFAGRVLEAARSSPTGRFGGNKVFIAHVWRALRDEPEFAAMGLGGFQHRLTAANNAGLLCLSRADLIEAMHEEDVRLSEVTYEGAIFHFVRI